MNKNIIAIAPLLSLAGCMLEYTAKQGEQTAQIKQVGGERQFLCYDKKAFSLYSHERPAVIPAAKTITIGQSLMYSYGAMEYWCIPKISFIPEPSALYVVDAHWNGNSCYLDLVKVDETTPVGLSAVEILGKGDCTIELENHGPDESVFLYTPTKRNEPPKKDTEEVLDPLNPSGRKY